MIDLESIAAASAPSAWLPEELPGQFAPVDPRRGEIVEIGRSRENRPLHGVRLGRGGRRLSLIAGAHADEPVGPSTLLAFSRWLSAAAEAEPLLAAATFSICPHINPDGAQRNARWSALEEISLAAYLASVVREAPGDDVEFGFPVGADTPARPENRAVAAFLAAGAPYDFHASLHGMALAEGAWFLIGRDHVAATATLRRDLARVVAAVGLPLHDWDRGGEKGFHRIEPGFCTTPTSTAMKAHFEALGQPAEAAKFLPSSMEFVAGLGRNPLVMVSEVPLFLVRPSPPTATVPGENFLAAMSALREARPADGADLAALEERFGIRPVARLDAMKLQLAMVLLGGGLAAVEELAC